MGILDTILAKSQQGKTVVMERQTAEAVVAFMTMVAAAPSDEKPDEPGVIDEAEYQAMEAIYDKDAVMKAFPFSTLNGKHVELMQQFSIGLLLGQRACLAELRDIRSKKPEVREKVVLLAMAVAAKGGTSEHEKNALRKGIKELGLDPAEFNL
jgi:tellurite resistance protein